MMYIQNCVGRLVNFCFSTNNNYTKCQLWSKQITVSWFLGCVFFFVDKISRLLPDVTSFSQCPFEGVFAFTEEHLWKFQLSGCGWYKIYHITMNLKKQSLSKENSKTAFLKRFSRLILTILEVILILFFLLLMDTVPGDLHQFADKNSSSAEDETVCRALNSFWFCEMLNNKEVSFQGLH